MALLWIAYGLPWLAATMIGLLRKQQEQTRYRLATAGYGLTGIITLVVLIRPPVEVVIGGFSRIAMALVILSSLGLTVHLIRESRYGPEREPGFYALLLVLIGGLNGVALAQLMVVMFISWGAIVFSTAKLLGYGNYARDVAADAEARRRRGMDNF